MTKRDTCVIQVWALGSWVTQAVKHQTLGLGLGHELTVSRIEPHIGLHAGSAETGWDSLCPSLSAPPPLTLSMCLSK